MPRIMIVEDDEGMRELFREHLEDAHEIVETGDATAALALALQSKPDCILLDLTLPEFSGFELCQTFSTLSVTRLTPVIVITSKPAAEYREFCLNLGAAEYIEKPVDFGRLKALLDAVLDRKPEDRRREPRVRLCVILRLKGADANGKEFDLLTASEDASANGFLANCPASLEIGATVDVFRRAGNEQRVGRATVVRVEWPGMPWQRYGFVFTEKPHSWILE